MENVLTFVQSTSQTAWKYMPRLAWAEQLKSPDAALQSAVTSSPGALKMKPCECNFVSQGHPLVRIAGLSGGAAIFLGAYGAHALGKDNKDQKRLFDTANLYHIVHTLALLAVPLAKRPYVTGPLMLGGMSIFCGTIYYQALTEDLRFRKATPVGGILLIVAWLSMVV